MNNTSPPPALPADFAARARVLGSTTLYEASGLPCSVDPLIRGIWSGAFIYPSEWRRQKGHHGWRFWR